MPWYCSITSPDPFLAMTGVRGVMEGLLRNFPLSLRSPSIPQDRLRRSNLHVANWRLLRRKKRRLAMTVSVCGFPAYRRRYGLLGMTLRDGFVGRPAIATPTALP